MSINSEFENHPIWKEPAGEFKPGALYNPDNDSLMIVLENIPYYCENIGDNLSVFRCRNENRIVGCQVNNVQSLIEKQSDDLYKSELEAVFPVYKELILSKYPGVNLDIRPSPAPSGEGFPYYISVFMVPDDRIGEFVNFVIDELPGQLEKRGVVDHYAIMQHSACQTKKYYPDMADNS